MMSLSAAPLRTVLGAGASLVVLAASFVACKSTGDSPERADGGVAAEPLFRAVQSDLVTSCGGVNGSCHVRGTYLAAPRWLGDPDPYVSAKKYKGIIPATHQSTDSLLLTQVVHEGPSLGSIDKGDLYKRVAEWLAAETPSPPFPSTGQFSVVEGANAVQLQGVGLGNATLTFVASSENGVLRLSGIKVQAPADTNLKLTAPFFVIHPRFGKVSADPDTNGFQGALTVPAGASVDFFTGKINLLHWDSAAQVRLVFQTIEQTPGVAVSGMCTALAVFQDKAFTAFSSPVQVVDPDEGDGGVGGGDGGAVVGTSSCLGCHGDTAVNPRYPAAVNSMDLRSMTTDPSVACASARRWISFADKSKSTIIGNPTGTANPNHPVKPLDPHDPIVQAIRTWVDAER